MCARPKTWFAKCHNKHQMSDQRASVYVHCVNLGYAQRTTEITTMADCRQCNNAVVYVTHPNLALFYIFFNVFFRCMQCTYDFYRNYYDLCFHRNKFNTENAIRSFPFQFKCKILPLEPVYKTNYIYSVLWKNVKSNNNIMCKVPLKIKRAAVAAAAAVESTNKSI